jgi:membrane fusion protein (multidrug efflux system)
MKLIPPICPPARVPASAPASVSALALALLLGGCDKPAGPGGAQGGAMPPPEVQVLELKAQSVPRTRELVGRLAATRVAQVRARVAGIVLSRVYKEGTDVAEGAVLFEIDPAQLRATLNAQEAAQARAPADADNAALIARRYQDLQQKRTLSQQDLDTALANERTTAAAVKQAQANLELARLDLSYATVRAPIAGRAGRALVTEGALVGQGEATRLTDVEQIDPIYVNFSQTVAELAELERRGNGAGAGPVPEARVEVLLPDGSPYRHAGTIDFSDLSVDPGTGAVSLRAVVPNPDKRLLPGMFVTLRLTAGHLDRAFLLPQPALQRDPAGAYVLVVDGAGKVEQRRVESQGMTKDSWILTGRLADGDRAIVSGLQKVKPGAEVRVAAPVGPQTGGAGAAEGRAQGQGPSQGQQAPARSTH